MTADAAYLTAVLAAYDDPNRSAAVLRAAQEQLAKPHPGSINEAARVLGCHRVSSENRAEIRPAGPSASYPPLVKMCSL